MFRKRFEEIIKEKGCTITEFADLLGLTRQSVSFYMNGDRRPDLQTLKRICETLNVSADWMLGLTDMRTPDTNLQTACQTLGLTEAAAGTLLRENGESLNYLLERPEEEWDLIKLQLDNYLACRKRITEDELKDGSCFALPGLSGDSVLLTAVQGTDYFARVVGDCIYNALADDIKDSMKKELSSD